MKKPKNLRVVTDLDNKDVFPVGHRGYSRSPSGGFLRDTLMFTPWAGDKPSSRGEPREISKRGYSRSPNGGFYQDRSFTQDVSEYHQRYWKDVAAQAIDEIEHVPSTPRALNESVDETERQMSIAHTGFARTPCGSFYTSCC